MGPICSETNLKFIPIILKLKSNSQPQEFSAASAQHFKITNSAFFKNQESTDESKFSNKSYYPRLRQEVKEFTFWNSFYRIPVLIIAQKSTRILEIHGLGRVHIFHVLAR